MPNIPGSIPLGGFIAPTDETDVYPVTQDVYNKGGFRTVLNISERDSITLERRKVGMVVYVVSEKREYRLVDGMNNSDWKINNMFNTKQLTTTLDFSEIVEIPNSINVINVFESVNGINVDKHISADDIIKHTPEDLREGEISFFQIDTLGYAGHFEDGSNVPVTIGSGQTAPKVREYSRFTLKSGNAEYKFIISSFSGNGSLNDDVKFIKADEQQTLPVGTYECVEITGFEFVDYEIKLSSLKSAFIDDVFTGGVASASTHYNGNDAYRAFDNDTDMSGWGNTNVMPTTLQYDLGVGVTKIIQSYSLYRNSTQSNGWSSDNYSPKDWTFEGSNNGVDWTILDTQINKIVQMNEPKKVFTFNNATAYRYYRLNIVHALNGNYVNITEMEGFESGNKNYHGEYITVITKTSGFFADLWDDINSGTITENLNTAHVYYTVSFDSRKTYKVFDGTSWRPIASNLPSVHGHIGDNDWYYRNIGSTWSKTGIQNDIMSAISKAVSQGSINQMSSSDFNALTDSEWNAMDGFNTDIGRFDASATIYSQDDNSNPHISNMTINIDESGYQVATMGESADYILHRKQITGVQSVVVGKRSDGKKDILITYI